MQTKITITRWTGNLAKIKAFYEKCGYGAIDSVSQTDLILVAEIDKALVCIVRLCDDKQDVKVLRGMQVLPKWRGRKVVGPALRDECGLRLARECYLTAYPNLIGFYGKILFRKVPEKSAPKFMQERI